MNDQIKSGTYSNKNNNQDISTVNINIQTSANADQG